MNGMPFRHPAMAAAEDGGAAGGAAPAAEPAPAEAQGAPSEPSSAAAAHAPAAEPREGGGGIPDAPSAPSEPSSAAAAHAPAAGRRGDGGGDGEGAEAGADGEAEADLSSMSDEEYAAAVVPDADGAEADRSLIGPMSRGLIELGVQPALMRKIAALYSEKVRDALAKDDAERAAAMMERNAKCEAEVSEQQWADFGAAYSNCIAGDEELRHLVDHTELGSSPAFIRLCALAGATLRVERAPAATASAGSGHADLDRKVFEATVPPNLR